MVAPVTVTANPILMLGPALMAAPCLAANPTRIGFAYLRTSQRCLHSEHLPR
jgi:hypothetical protein